MKACFSRTFLWLALATPALAAESPVGTIAELNGQAEISRPGSAADAPWAPAQVGGPIHQGDQIRTGRPGRVRIVFQDESVLVLSDDSLVRVDESVFSPADGSVRSLLQMFRGKVRAVVTEYYQQRQASYEIQTPTAVAGVRGTEFVVEYDETARTTRVSGIEGTVAVHSVLDRLRNGVLVTAGEGTAVRQGEFPTPVDPLDDDSLRRVIDGFEFVGGGLLGRGGGASGTDAAVPEPDRAPRVSDAEPQGQNRLPDAGRIIDQPPAIGNEGGRLGIRF
jgi:ferric-dicitrate binding protein FerR (iron transport regulator)